MTAEPDEVKRNAERAARFRLLAALWGFASDQRDQSPVHGPRAQLGETKAERVSRRPAAPGRVRDCHRKAIAQLIEVKAVPGAASLGAVSTCGSPWVCPVCSAKVASKRQTEVQDSIRAWQGRGGAVVLVTLTLRHSRDHALEDTWNAITAGWAAVRNGRGWRDDRARWGIGGFVRVVEVTHSHANGWHPHVHALLFVDGSKWTGSDADREELRASLYGRWSGKLAESGYTTLEWTKNPETGKLEPVAVDVRSADALGADYLADYFAKFGYTPKVEGGSGSLAREVARGDKKRGRKGSRTPWEILEAAADDDGDALALWSEWEVVSHGRRQYSWAQGFRESLDLDVMCADRDAVSAADAALEVVALLSKASFRDLVADLKRTRKLPGASRLTRMLDQAATLDPETFRRWCARASLEVLDPAALDSVRAKDSVNKETGEIMAKPGRVGPGTPDRARPVHVPAKGRTLERLGTFGNRRDQAARERRAALLVTLEPVSDGWRADQPYSATTGQEGQEPARPPVVPPGVTLKAPGAAAARVRALYGL